MTGGCGVTEEGGMTEGSNVTPHTDAGAE